MLKYDDIISLGDVLQILTWLGLAVGAYYSVRTQLALFRQVLEHHSATLVEHAKRLDRYEESIVRVIGELQRLVGRVESMRIDR